MEQVLDRNMLEYANRYFQLSDKRFRDLLGLLDSIRGNEAVQRQFQEMHCLFFHTDDDASCTAARWREAGACFGDRQAGVAALLVMSGLDHMMAVYRERCIPDNILRDSLRDMTIWMDDYEERTGQTGLGLDVVGWLLRSLRGTLFRLGRFQFIHRSFGWKAGVAVRRADRLPVAFFLEPESLRGDGQVDGTNEIYDREHGWQSSFEIAGGNVTGTPLHPGGYAVQSKLRLSLDEWDFAFQPGDAMLDIHIPKDGKMEFEQSRDSILGAMNFFDRYFPDKPYKVIHLCTWFLDAQLQKLLPPESNIVRFQREFYLFPVKATHIGCYERVFGNPDIDITSAPEDTTLRKVIKEFVLAGNNMRYNAGIILPEDMKHFGKARYQTESAAALERMLGHAQ